MFRLIIFKIISIHLIIIINGQIHSISNAIEQYQNYSLNLQNLLNTKINEINFIPKTVHLMTSKISNIILPDLMKWTNFTIILIDPLNVKQIETITVNDKFHSDVYFVITINECDENLEFFFGWINYENLNDWQKCEFKNRKTEIILRGKQLFVGYRQMIPFIYKSFVNKSLLTGIEHEMVKIIAKRNNLELHFIDCTKLIDCLRR